MQTPFEMDTRSFNISGVSSTGCTNYNTELAIAFNSYLSGIVTICIQHNSVLSVDNIKYTSIHTNGSLSSKRIVA